MELKELAPLVNYSLLNDGMSSREFGEECEFAIDRKLGGVIVNVNRLLEANPVLEKSPVSVIGALVFEQGFADNFHRCSWINRSVEVGLDAIELLFDLEQFRHGQIFQLRSDIRENIKAAKGRQLKWVINSPQLEEAELRRLIPFLQLNGVTCIKTCSELIDCMADCQHVEFIREIVGDNLEIEATRGIQGIGSYEYVMKLLAAGATRIATSRAPALFR